MVARLPVYHETFAAPDGAWLVRIHGRASGIGLLSEHQGKAVDRAAALAAVAAALPAWLTAAMRKLPDVNATAAG